MSYTLETGIVALTKDEAQRTLDACADVLCWFRGFRAASPEAELPPDLDYLKTIRLRVMHLLDVVEGV